MKESEAKEVASIARQLLVAHYVNRRLPIDMWGPPLLHQEAQSAVLVAVSIVREVDRKLAEFRGVEPE